MFGNILVNPSNTKRDYAKVPHADIARSLFNRSHNYKTTLNTDYLIPIYTDEVLPGDTFNVRLTSVARLNTPLHPFMDSLFMDFFFFYVPNRLIWNNWQRFMGERDPDPDSSIDYTVPVIDCPAGGWTEATLADYFGIPTKIDNIEVNTLHFRAYNLIWNEWFRSEYLQDSVTVDKDDGPDDPADYVLLKRGKRHDYFTSCLPWPQKADSGVELPLGTVAPIYTDGTVDTDNLSVYNTNTSAYQELAATAAWTDRLRSSSTAGAEANRIYTDLSVATAATINSIREAFQLQKLLERDSRGGSRYIELIKAHFGVSSPDSRLQRPEYLGGGSKRVTVAPVPNTFYSSGAGSYPGQLGAIGFQNQSGVGFTKSFTEHGVLIGLVNIRADLNYQQGLDRMWKRQTRYDYYFPCLAHLGEQAVLNQEIYMVDGTVDTDTDGTVDNEEVFGYQERWAELRSKNSLITGLFRSNATGTLDSWHLAQEFGSLPVLGDTFITEDVPIERVVAVTNQPAFNFDGYFDIKVGRALPTFSIPGLIDHF